MKRQLLHLLILPVLLSAAACATVAPRPDPACPDNLVQENGEEYPGLLLGLDDHQVTYQLLDGTVKTFPPDEVVRVDLGRRVGDPHLKTLADLDDPEIVALIEEAMAKPLDDKYSSTLLLWEYLVTLEPDGREHYTRRVLIRIEQQAGLSQANKSNTYNPLYETAKVDFAYAVSPQGKISVLSAGAVRDSALGSGRADEDQRRRVQIAIPGAEVGSFIYFRFSCEDRPDRDQTYQPLFLRQTYTASAPIHLLRIVVRVPAATKLNIIERNFQPFVTKSDRSDGRQRVLTYEARDVPILLPEPAMPSWVVVAPHLEIAPDAQWSQLAAIYREEWEKRTAVDDLVAETAEKLTADREEREAAAVLYQFVLREIEDNDTGWWSRDPLPKPPAQTLADRRGNIIDRYALLYALARSIGLQVDLLLFAPWRSCEAMRETPSFGHLEQPLLRFRFGDETAWAGLTKENRVFGDLPDFLAESDYLDLAAGTLGKSPAKAVACNSADYVYDIFLRPDGGARIEEKHCFTGDEALKFRSYRHLTTKKLREKMERQIRNYASRSTLVDFSITDMHGLTDPICLERTSECPLFTVSGGGKLHLLRLFDLNYDEIERVNPTRLYPLQINDLRRTTRVFRFHLPPDFTVHELPAPLDLRIGWSWYKAKWELDGQTLTFTVEAEVFARTMPAAGFTDLETYLRVRRQLVETPILLEQTP